MFVKNLPLRRKTTPHQSVLINEARPVPSFGYYEYKYLVEHRHFTQVKNILDEFFALSDPFPSGIVDSIYYDTRGRDFFAQCLNGEDIKSKFRIRGYGNGTYNQAHQKMKNLFGVSKYKAKLVPCFCPFENAPVWHELMPAQSFDHDYNTIMYNARKHGPLYPAVRIQYYRYRFRKNDYRITFDTNIEAFAPVNGLPCRLGHTVLPHHVLEIKTRDLRPNLPFIGLIPLSQVSFSKFMLGLIQLND